MPVLCAFCFCFLGSDPGGADDCMQRATGSAVHITLLRLLLLTKHFCSANFGGASGADPFTGSGGYRPVNGVSNGNSGLNGSAAADPFTGSGSYRPQGAATSSGVATLDSQVKSQSSNSVILSTRPSLVPPTQEPYHLFLFFLFFFSFQTTNPFFPCTEYVTFDQAKPDAILKKLGELNDALSADHQHK